MEDGHDHQGEAHHVEEGSRGQDKVVGSQSIWYTCCSSFGDGDVSTMVQSAKVAVCEANWFGESYYHI